MIDRMGSGLGFVCPEKGSAVNGEGSKTDAELYTVRQR